jgi:hypothetical protein
MEAEIIQTFKVAVVERANSQKLGVPGAGANNRGELLTDREAVVKTIKLENVV